MERSGFFDSEVVGQNPDGSPIYDREYLSEFFALYFSSFIGNGVFPNPATGIQVIANNNMTVILKLGKAWINGYFYENTDNLALNIDVADGVLNRVDRIVLRLDFLTREIKAVVKKGDFASNAIAKALQRDADAYEIALADINISKGIISISQANIIDLRLNKDLCGIVHGTVEQVDTTAIFNQYLDWYNAKTGQYQADMSNMEAQFQSDFNNWFNSIKGQLSGDIAGNLLNLINENVDKIGNLSTLNTTDKTSTVNAINEVNNNLVSHKADNTKHVAKDGTLQSGLNSEKINGKTATATPATTEKVDLIGMINETFTNANNGKTSVANAIGSPSVATETFAQLANDINTQKNNLATNLTNKGQSSNGTETLANLVAKVANVNTGKRYASGTVTSGSYGEITVTGLTFTPSIIIVRFPIFQYIYYNAISGTKISRIGGNTMGYVFSVSYGFHFSFTPDENNPSSQVANWIAIE